MLIIIHQLYLLSIVSRRTQLICAGQRSGNTHREFVFETEACSCEKRRTEEQCVIGSFEENQRSFSAKK